MSNVGDKRDELVDGREICPICLRDDVVLVKTKCKHETCLPCMERLLTIPVMPASERNRVYAQIPNDDDDFDIPTRGRCPMCREPICLFELERVDTTYEISKNHNLSSTGLSGRVYVTKRSAIGDQSIHFPSAEDGSDALPYIDFTLDNRIQLWTHKGGADLKIYFEPDCHFHHATRTFHGRIRWSDDCAKRLFGSMFWEYSIAFSADLQYATRGVLLKRRDTCQNPDCMESMCQFKLDGRWSVTWPDNHRRSVRTYVVHNNVAYDGNKKVAHLDGNNLLLTTSDNDISGKHEVHAISMESKPWFEAIEIRIGETIDIDAPPAHPKQRMMWTRQAFGSRHLDVVSIGCGSSQMQYRVVATDETTSSKAIYVSASVWGNTFCQALTVGLASYHFMKNSQEGAYISYENELTSRWPPLDDGSPIPNKIWFTEPSFDASERIFRGKIDWYSSHGTTWQGCRWWRYEMQFSSNYTCIMGGLVKSAHLGSETEMDMSVFGDELVYLNAGLIQQCNDSGDYSLVEEAMEMLDAETRTNQSLGTPQNLTQFLILFDQVRSYGRTLDGTGILRYPRSVRF